MRMTIAACAVVALGLSACGGDDGYEIDDRFDRLGTLGREDFIEVNCLMFVQAQAKNDAEMIDLIVRTSAIRLNDGDDSPTGLTGMQGVLEDNCPTIASAAKALAESRE